MPLPVSATTYFPNPLTQVQATQAGKQVGSDFANITEGFSKGLSTVLDTTERIERIKTIPEEQRRKDQAAELSELKFELDQRKEERLAQKQEFEEDYKTQDLAIKERGLDIKQDLNAARIKKINISTALAAQRQAQQNLLDGATEELVTKGRPDSIVGILQGKRPQDARMRREFTDYLLKDSERAQEVVNRLEDAVAEGRVRQEDAMRINSFIGTLSHSKNVQTAEELAKDAPAIFGSELGVVPDKYSEVEIKMQKDDEGNNKWVFKEKTRDGRTEPMGELYALGMDPKKTNDLHKHSNSWSKRARMLKQVNKAASQAAKNRAEMQRLAQEQGGGVGGSVGGGELPTKISKNRRTPAQRVGLARTTVSNEGEKIEGPPTKRQDEARRNAQTMRRREMGLRAPELSSPNSFLR